MSPSPLDYLRHVLDEADYLARHVPQLTREQFLQDETAKRAFVRSMEIIGEAVKKVPDEIRVRYPDVEWRAVAGMRDYQCDDLAGEGLGAGVMEVRVE